MTSRSSETRAFDGVSPALRSRFGDAPEDFGVACADQLVEAIDVFRGNSIGLTATWPTHRLIGNTNTAEECRKPARVHTVYIQHTRTVQPRAPIRLVTLTLPTTMLEPTTA